MHSATMKPALKVTAVPMFSDNYAWLLQNAAHRTAVIVDPADASVALASLAQPGVSELVGVLTTHHHHDHSGGNVAVLAARPGITVVGGAGEDGRIPAANLLVKDGQRFELGGFSILALHTPCHTKGHICYLVTGDPDHPPACFTGDTLFSAGCGRFFEGDATVMLNSLTKLKQACTPDTLIYCGHEYTVANLRFGLHVEPQNAAMHARLAECTALVGKGLPTVPSTMALELETNVFLRTSEPSVIAFTHPGATAADPIEVLARLREAKNLFTG